MQFNPGEWFSTGTLVAISQACWGVGFWIIKEYHTGLKNKNKEIEAKIQILQIEAAKLKTQDENNTVLFQKMADDISRITEHLINRKP